MRFLMLSALAATALSSACYIDVDNDDHRRTGSLTLQYSFGGLDCTSAGVDRIDIRVIGSRDDYVDTLRCRAFERGVTIDGLLEGTYDVSIEGRSYDGDVIYALDTASVRVRGFTSQSYDVDVPDVSGALTIYWTFAGSGRCGEVFDLRVLLVDPDGFVYDDDTYDCEFGGITYDVLPSGRWRLSLDALDSRGRVVYRASDLDLRVLARSSNEYTVDLTEVR